MEWSTLAVEMLKFTAPNITVYVLIIHCHSISYGYCVVHGKPTGTITRSILELLIVHTIT